MARSPKFSAEQKEKFLKKTKKLGAQEAAKLIGISVQALYAWRKAAQAKKDISPSALEKAEIELDGIALTTMAHPKAAKPKAKVNLSVNKVIKAVGSIQSSLNTIETYLKTIQVA